MDKSYAYEEDEREEGLTFKKIGHFFAKGWLRMVVYTLALIALASVIVLPIKFFYKSEQVAETQIEFIYEGIEKGLDPIGGALDTDNIRSMKVLSAAVEAADLGGTVTDITKLRSSMRVEGVQTDEYVRLTQAAANGDTNAANTLRNYVMRPTQFKIIISEPSKLGLSDTQAKILLDKVVTSYYKDFQARFSTTEQFSAEVYALSDESVLEFTDIYDRYMSELESIETYLNRLSADAEAVSAMSDGTVFAKLSAELSGRIRDLESFNNFVLDRSIWRNKAVAHSALTREQESITGKLKTLSDYIEQRTDMIKNIQPNKIVTESGGQKTETSAYPDEYYEILESLDAENRKVQSYNDQLLNIKMRLDKLSDIETPTSDALKNDAMEMLRNIEAQNAAFVQKVNELSADYDSAFAASAVRQTRSSVITRRTSDLNVVIVYICVALVGILAAAIVTGIKISKANAAAKDQTASASADVAVGGDVSEAYDEVAAQSEKAAKNEKSKKQ